MGPGPGRASTHPCQLLRRPGARGRPGTDVLWLCPVSGRWDGGAQAKRSPGLGTTHVPRPVPSSWTWSSVTDTHLSPPPAEWLAGDTGQTQGADCPLRGSKTTQGHQLTGHQEHPGASAQHRSPGGPAGKGLRWRPVLVSTEGGGAGLRLPQGVASAFRSNTCPGRAGRGPACSPGTGGMLAQGWGAGAARKGSDTGRGPSPQGTGGGPPRREQGRAPGWRYIHPTMPVMLTSPLLPRLRGPRVSSGDRGHRGRDLILVQGPPA